MLLPLQPLCAEVLREKYLQAGEASAEDVFDRVARALASVEAVDRRAAFERQFRQHLRAGGIGAGRIMSAAGTDLPATLINCFVQPVGDHLAGTDDQGRPGLQEALRQAAQTLRLGGGVGYDFSHVRPTGAQARWSMPGSGGGPPLRDGTDANAGGPCGFIDRFDLACEAVERAGVRRGAQMGVLRIDHPDVQAFITAKRSPGRWSHFNVSVAVTDAFIEALQQDAPWELVHSAQPAESLRRQGAHLRADGLWVYRSLPARELWDTLMRAAYDAAEPGVLFIDRIRQDNNLRALELVEATNPCGEQPLPAYGCCNLGPLILPRFVRHPFGHGGPARLDFGRLARHAALQVRLLDNVLELTAWPLPQQAREASAKRRVGVGFTGLGDALVMLGLRYDSPLGREMAQRIACCLRDAAYTASVALARERGAFPLFDAPSYLAKGTFASRLPEKIRAQIRAHGIRNSHLLSVAPAGSVSLAFADNASNGIEPAFAWACTRAKRGPDGRVVDYTVEDHAFRVFKALGGDPLALPAAFVSALDISPQDHVAMMQAVQPFIDAAISKTVNVAPERPYEDFQQLYLQAWHAGLKGLAAYRPNAIRGAVLQEAPPHSGRSCSRSKPTGSARPVVALPRSCQKARPCTRSRGGAGRQQAAAAGAALTELRVRPNRASPALWDWASCLMLRVNGPAAGLFEGGCDVHQGAAGL